MKYRTHGYRFADYLFENHKEFSREWKEVADALDVISEDDVISGFEGERRAAKSISQSLNRLIKKELAARAWNPESYIFADKVYGENSKGMWRIDFAKRNLSVEVAFNHRSDILWNLMKPTLASELNHVSKAIQTKGGVVVAATAAMKSAGGFDNACGTYEDYVQYLRPLSLKLTTPLLLVGLEAPETFRIDVEPVRKGSSTKHGIVRRLVVERAGKTWCPDCGGDTLREDACPHCGRRLMYR